MFKLYKNKINNCSYFVAVFIFYLLDKQTYIDLMDWNEPRFNALINKYKFYLQGYYLKGSFLSIIPPLRGYFNIEIFFTLIEYFSIKIKKISIYLYYIKGSKFRKIVKSFFIFHTSFELFLEKFVLVYEQSFYKKTEKLRNFIKNTRNSIKNLKKKFKKICIS